MAYKDPANKRAYDKAHPEMLRRAGQKYAAKPSSKLKAELRRLKNLYGLDETAAVAVHNRKLGPCDICGKMSQKPLHVDHNHMTGVFRGVLCPSCNITVGMIELHLLQLESILTYINYTPISLEQIKRKAGL